MKIFISWSQDRSRKFAEALQDFLQCVIQEVKPFLSSGGGIESGQQWFPTIMDNLKSTMQGVICLTPENKEAPWIMFESGAIAKGMEQSRIHIILLGMKTHEVGPPLSQFHMVYANEEGIRKLVNDMNGHLENKLDAKRLERVFEKHWSEFQQKIGEIEQEEISSVRAKRSNDDIMLEILNTVRTFDSRIRKMELKDLETTVFVSPKGVVPSMPKMESSETYNFFWTYGIAPFSERAARIMTKNGYTDSDIRDFQKYATKIWDLSADPGEQ